MASSVGMALGEAVMAEYYSTRLGNEKEEIWEQLQKRYEGKSNRQKQLMIHFAYRNQLLQDTDVEILDLLQPIRGNK